MAFGGNWGGQQTFGAAVRAYIAAAALTPLTALWFSGYRDHKPLGADRPSGHLHLHSGKPRLLVVAPPPLVVPLQRLLVELQVTPLVLPLQLHRLPHRFLDRHHLHAPHLLMHETCTHVVSRRIGA